jgi:hypothetical protein
VVDARGGRLSYFVLTYDVTSERVLALTGHGPDFVGAVLALSSSMDQHRDQPDVIVRLLVGTSVADLVERHADLFAGLRLPD